MDAINVVLFPIESLHYDVFLLFCKNTMNAIVSFMTFDLLTALIAVSIIFLPFCDPPPLIERLSAMLSLTGLLQDRLGIGDAAGISGSVR